MPSSDLVPTAPVAPERRRRLHRRGPVAEVACDFGEEAVDHAKELRRLSAYTTASSGTRRAALRELAASCGPARARRRAGRRARRPLSHARARRDGPRAAAAELRDGARRAAREPRARAHAARRSRARAAPAGARREAWTGPREAPKAVMGSGRLKARRGLTLGAPVLPERSASDAPSLPDPSELESARRRRCRSAAGCSPLRRPCRSPACVTSRRASSRPRRSASRPRGARAPPQQLAGLAARRGARVRGELGAELDSAQAELARAHAQLLRSGGVHPRWELGAGFALVLAELISHSRCGGRGRRRRRR